MSIHNASRATLTAVSVKVESLGDRGKRYSLPDFRPDEHRRVYVQPITESHITVTFTDSSKQQHIQTVYGYAEAGYCAAVKAIVQPTGEVKASVDATCSFSWFDFL